MSRQGPPDLNELAHRIVASATSEEVEEKPDPAFVESGRKGGEARSKALSPERRSEIAAAAAAVRWAQTD